MPVVAFSADPVVVVNSSSSVTVDGQPAGTVVDVLANSKAANIRARVLDAWLAYEKNLADKAEARIKAAVEASNIAIEKNSLALADAKKARAEAQDLALNASVRAETAGALITALQKQVRSLGGEPVAKP